jgi:disulfide bond formation protein DsbB
LREAFLYAAWVQALIATLGSLFFSEVMGFVPCTLCWYQRILMYPLVVVLTVGILLRDSKLRYYTLPLSILGLGIAVYHNLLHYGLIPEETFGTCSAGVSCTVRWFEWFGFISIPQLSLMAFLVITICMFVYKRGENNVADQ